MRRQAILTCIHKCLIVSNTLHLKKSIKSFDFLSKLINAWWHQLGFNFLAPGFQCELCVCLVSKKILNLNHLTDFDSTNNFWVTLFFKCINFFLNDKLTILLHAINDYIYRIESVWDFGLLRRHTSTRKHIPLHDDYPPRQDISTFFVPSYSSEDHLKVKEVMVVYNFNKFLKQVNRKYISWNCVSGFWRVFRTSFMTDRRMDRWRSDCCMSQLLCSRQCINFASIEILSNLLFRL